MTSGLWGLIFLCKLGNILINQITTYSSGILSALLLLARMPTPRFGRSFKAPDENGCQKKSVIWLIMAVGAADEV